MSYQCLLDLLRRLGLDISQKKLCPPSTKAICLDIEVDTIRRTISVPDEKLRRICQMVDDWDNRRFCSVCQLQSLLGHLMYIQKCVRPSCFFVNRILELLRSNYDANSITLNHDFKRDIRGHSGRVATLSPPTSEAGVRSPSWPQVGKLVVSCR